MTQLLPLSPVEADPGRVPAVRGDGDLELHSGRDYYWPRGRKYDFSKT